MLTYDLERRGDLPRYDYLYRCIKGDILSGRLAAGEVARCYNLLELRLNRPILDNIIFLGLAQSISRAGKPSGARSRHPEP